MLNSSDSREMFWACFCRTISCSMFKPIASTSVIFSTPILNFYFLEKSNCYNALSNATITLACSNYGLYNYFIASRKLGYSNYLINKLKNVAAFLLKYDTFIVTYFYSVFYAISSQIYFKQFSCSH